MREPRDPLLKVVYNFLYRYKDLIQHSKHIIEVVKNDIDLKNTRESRLLSTAVPQLEFLIGIQKKSTICAQLGEMIKMTSVHIPPQGPATACASLFDNDPSAGSPTETLLRLLLPLNDQV
jgi:hypothetical protein